MTGCNVEPEKYEKQFLGKWVADSGGKVIIYSFYEKDGTYKVDCIAGDISYNNQYWFDEYTATSKTLTLYQNGKKTKYNYSFEDGYLYIDNIEFEPFD